MMWLSLSTRPLSTAEDFARAAARLATDAAGSPLPQERVALAVAFAEAGSYTIPLSPIHVFSFLAFQLNLIFSW